MTADLFDVVPGSRPSREAMAEGAVLLRGFVRPFESDLIAALREIIAQSPFRRMFTPGGHQMSVAMTNCGSAGWVTDHGGYRYDGRWIPIAEDFVKHFKLKAGDRVHLAAALPRVEVAALA